MRLAWPLLLLFSACGGEQEPARNGLWRATTIDGAPVGRTDYLIRIRGGRVVGGKDGCNSWSYDMTRPPEPNGTRMVVSTCIGCPGLAEQAGYWRALGNGNVVPVLIENGRLRLRAGGSEILARRAASPAAAP